MPFQLAGDLWETEKNYVLASESKWTDFSCDGFTSKKLDKLSPKFVVQTYNIKGELIIEMNLLFRFLLTLNATWWMIVVYGLKSQWTYSAIPTWGITLLMLCLPVVLSVISVGLSSKFDQDSINGCSEFSLADQEFLPVYLGYFFVSLSVPDDTTMIFLYAIIFVFTFISQTQYFNPIFLLFGYHYYHVLTIKGTRVFIIYRGQVIRSKEKIVFGNLRRINDTTYIVRKER